jgi:putative membrane protein
LLGPWLHILRGFCIGTADIVPGVSGGTLAFILGIYRRLIEALRGFDLTLLRLLAHGEVRAAVRQVDLPFLLPLGIGVALALAFFTRVVPLPRLITTHPEPVYGLFFGLVAASVAVLLRSADALRALDLPWLLAGLLAGLAVVNLVPVETPETAWFVFLSGMLAISAMLLPGISGSFVLLLLQKYAYVFDAIGHLQLAVVIPFGLGCVAGVLAFSRLLGWLMHRYYHRTLVTITGLLVGSLWIIWPFQERTYEVVRGKERLVGSHPAWPAADDPGLLPAVLMMALGAGVVLLVHGLARRHEGPARRAPRKPS